MAPSHVADDAFRSRSSQAMICLAPYAFVVTASWLVCGLVWQPVLQAATAWDAHHYLAIAVDGYPTAITTTFSNLAFFPGMPLAIRLIQTLGFGWPLSGFIVSIVSGAILCVCSGLLVSRYYGDSAGVRAAALLAVSPAAFLFGIAYADPLAIACVAGALLALDSRQWVLAGAIGAIATATSPLALSVILVGLWVAIRQGGRAWIAVATMPLGVALFIAYLWAHTGSPTIWLQAQKHGWGQGFDLLNTWQRLHASTAIGIPITVASCLFLGGLGIYAMKRAHVPVAWWLVTIPVLLAGLFDQGSWLNPRFLLNAFPLSLAVAVNVRGRWFMVLLIFSLIALQFALVAYIVLWFNITAQP
jgi:hypothetical protein